MASIVVVDHDASSCALFARWLRDAGHDVLTGSTGTDAVSLITNAKPEVAVLDCVLPDSSGLVVAERCRTATPHIPIVVLTGISSTEDAFAAGQIGIAACLRKPIRHFQFVEEVNKAIARAFQLAMGPKASDLPASGGSDGMVGAHAAMARVFRFIERAAALDETVLILGETGTGKELVAKAIHRRSKRSPRSMVAVNCSAIPDSLFESELFGHERGAFTDAKSAVPGRFEQADGSTLFLDEIGDLSASGQAKLLRTIETHEISRVGGAQTKRVDFRLIAATNADLDEQVRRGQFRLDLLLRLSGLKLFLPPVRDRGDDVTALLDHVLERVAHDLEMKTLELSGAARSALTKYSWPGNVREIYAVVKNAALLSEGQISVPDLPLSIARLASFAQPPGAPSVVGGTLTERLKAETARLEASLITEAMAAHGHNVTKAAAALGVHRLTLTRKLRRVQ